MPRLDSWLAKIDEERATIEVAKKVLTQRLQQMHRLLKDAFPAKDEVEAVHDLRVWTRRCEAALVVFEPLLPRKRRRWMRKRLRRVRRAAGAVRDCDVHWKHLNDEPQPNRRLLRGIARERKVARRELALVLRKLLHKRRLKPAVMQLTRRISAPHDLRRELLDYRGYARQSLSEMANAFFQAAERPLADDNALHRWRIAAKRWRYALELAAGALDRAAAGELYEQLSDLQDRLGAVHDVQALCERIQDALNSARGKRRRAKLREEWERQQRRHLAGRNDLRAWWTAQRREQLVACWRRTCSHPSHQPARSNER